jgi:hypothetical protein
MNNDMSFRKYTERLHDEREVLDAYVEVSYEALQAHGLSPIEKLGVAAVAAAHYELNSLVTWQPKVIPRLLKATLREIATASELLPPEGAKEHVRHRVNVALAEAYADDLISKNASPREHTRAKYLSVKPRSSQNTQI